MHKRHLFPSSLGRNRHHMSVEEGEFIVKTLQWGNCRHTRHPLICPRVLQLQVQQLYPSFPHNRAGKNPPCIVLLWRWGQTCEKRKLQPPSRWVRSLTTPTSHPGGGPHGRDADVMCVTPSGKELVKTKPLIIPIDGGKEPDKVLTYSWSNSAKQK